MRLDLGEGVIVSRPNLFEYATSELSQDAFLCWLIAWAGCGAGDDGHDTELHRCGVEFIRMLYHKQHPEVDQDSLTIELLSGPERQREHIDVYFRAKVADRIVSFIIEDKTGTSHHSNQLERYYRSIDKDKLKEDEIIGVYLKTHYWYPEDYEASEANYLLVDGKELIDFLHGFNCSNEIFLDYRKSLDEYLNSLSKALAYRLPTKEFSAECQFSFMLELVKQLRRVSGSSVTNQEAGNFLRRGTSYGDPWTQLDVFRGRMIATKEILETIYYRMDVRKDRKSGNYLPSICLRQWAPLKEEGKDEERLVVAKNERLTRYREVAKKIEAGPVCRGLNFGEIRNGGKGDNERDIAIFFLENASDVSLLLKELPAFHIRFVEACIKAERLPKAQLTPEECRKNKRDELKKLKNNVSAKRQN